MAEITYILLMMILGPAAFDDVIKHPPRDLAGLVRAESALLQLGAKTDEESLIALLQAGKAKALDTSALEAAVKQLAEGDFQERKDAEETLAKAGAAAKPFLEEAAKSKDPEVRITAKRLLDRIHEKAAQQAQDTDYAKRLFAICHLADLKAQSAVPVLRRLTKTSSPTIRSAATEALTAIEGKELEEPDPAKLIEAIVRKVPKETGFVAAADMVSDRQRHTLTQIINRIRGKKELNEQLKPYLAQLPRNQERMQRELVKLIALIGNIRIDAAVLMVSDQAGITSKSGYAGIVVKGEHEAARLAGFLQKKLRSQKKEYQGKTYYGTRFAGPAFCSLDDETFVFSVGPQHNGAHMMPMLDALLGDEKEEVPEHLNFVLEESKRKTSRIMAAGALSEGQKQTIRREVTQELNQVKQRIQANPMPQLQSAKAMMEAVLGLTQPVRFTGKLEKARMLTVNAFCRKKEDAKNLGDSFMTMDKMVRMMLQNQLGMGNPQQQELIRSMKLDKAFVAVEQADEEVEIRVDPSRVIMFPVFFMAF